MEYNAARPHSALGYRPPAPVRSVMYTLALEMVQNLGQVSHQSSVINHQSPFAIRAEFQN